MNGLREFIETARDTTTTPTKRARRNWDETEYSTALDLRLTGNEAATKIGCSERVVQLERAQWLFE